MIWKPSAPRKTASRLGASEVPIVVHINDRGATPGGSVQKNISWIRFAYLVILLTLVSAGAQADDRYSQSFLLKPGWNAIYLEVQPDPGDPGTVFAGIPLVSVWTWAEKGSSAQFLVDPAELEWNNSSWLGYRTASNELVLNNLHLLVANRAYLVKITGTANVPLVVTGRPSVAPVEWVADSFNLMGFAVDPAVSLSLGQYLALSPAHAGQALYVLDPIASVWTFVNNPFSQLMRSGEAYWVYTAGSSGYRGPIELDLDGSSGIDFGASIGQRLFRIRNVSGIDRTIEIRQLPSATPVELAFRSFDPVSKTFQRQPLSSLGAVTVPAGQSVPLTLVAQRQDFGSAEVGSVLEITDGRGVRLLVPVKARR